MILQHKHVLIRAEIMTPPKENELGFMKEWFTYLVSQLNMKVLSGPHLEYCHMVGNKGFTGVCIIETSHIACHIWDEVSPSLMQLDVYTCGEMDLNVVFKGLDPFDPVKIEYKYLDREHGLKVLDVGETIPEKIAS
jgi:S-adenosylmethionine/arginine decarboxylase-like enzyme